MSNMTICTVVKSCNCSSTLDAIRLYVCCDALTVTSCMLMVLSKLAFPAEWNLSIASSSVQLLCD